MSILATNLFAELVADGESGSYYELKPIGYAALIFVILGLWLAGSLIRNTVMNNGMRNDVTGDSSADAAGRVRKRSRGMARPLVFSAMAIALAYVTSMIKVVDMPMGGAVTLLSMMFVSMIGYWYGLGTGLTAAVSYGFLQLIINPYIISLPQMAADYILAFGALGLSGLFSKRNNGLIWGYLTGVTMRFVFVFISGMIFFGSYASAYHMSAPLYSFLYNGAYIGGEAVLTVIIMLLPPVKRTFVRVREMAVSLSS